MSDGMLAIYVLIVFFAGLLVFVVVAPFVFKDLFKSIGPSVPPIYKND